MTAVGKQSPSIGYFPHGLNLERPFDRRRFPRYAAMRGMVFDVISGWDRHDIIVLSPRADVTKWADAPGDRLIVVDLPDAFLDEGPGLRRSVRGLAKWVSGEIRRPVLDYHRAVERLLERADAVVCSTDEQAVGIGRYNPNVHPILDLHGELGPRRPVARPSSDRLDIVWEGLTATLPAIRPLLPALRSIADRVEVGLHIVTDLVAPRYMNRFLPRPTAHLVEDWGIDVKLYQWSVDKLTEVAGGCDLAIVPVDLTDPMAVGKPENRMRIFWRLGLPVVASASPANVRAAVRAGVEDRFLCSTTEDWAQALGELYARPSARLAIAEAGQTTALTTYSEESLAERWDRLFDSL